MMIELQDLTEFDTHVAAGRTLSDVVLQGLDLRERSDALRSDDVAGALLSPADEVHSAVQV